MQLKKFHVVGFYKDDYSNGIEFTLEAISFSQARAFINAFIPNFRIERIQHSVAAADTHYDFSVVNAAVSAQFHLRNRRTCGQAVRALVKR